MDSQRAKSGYASQLAVKCNTGEVPERPLAERRSPLNVR